MAHTLCNDGYCESIQNREASSTMTMASKLSIIGGCSLAVIAWTLLLWYEVTIGIYIDPASLS